MFYIYCYTNNFNNKKYVGQTNNINRRRNEHRHSAYTEKSKDYNSLFHKKIREYGEENFTFEILEEINTTDTDLVDSREVFWIQKLNSYVKNQKGYNITLGGQNKGRHKTITKEKIEEVVNLLKNSTLTYQEIYNQTGVSLRVIVDINKGNYSNYFLNETFPIRKTRIPEETKDIIKELLLTTNSTRQQIADECEVSLSTVKRIKAQLNSN